MVPLDAERLADGIAHLLTHPRVAEHIAATGYKTSSFWTWENVARRKMELIPELRLDSQDQACCNRNMSLTLPDIPKVIGGIDRQSAELARQF
jgi:hypothetical protein